MSERGFVTITALGISVLLAGVLGYFGLLSESWAKQYDGRRALAAAEKSLDLAISNTADLVRSGGLHISPEGDLSGSANRMEIHPEPLAQIYRWVLGREPSLQEIEQWSESLLSGALDIIEVENQLRGNAGSFGSLDASDLRAVYRTLLGRFPTDSELSQALGNLTSVDQFPTVAAQLAANNNINAIAAENLRSDILKELISLLHGESLPVETCVSSPSDRLLCEGIAQGTIRISQIVQLARGGTKQANRVYRIRGGGDGEKISALHRLVFNHRIESMYITCWIQHMSPGPAVGLGCEGQPGAFDLVWVAQEFRKIVERTGSTGISNPSWKLIQLNDRTAIEHTLCKSRNSAATSLADCPNVTEQIQVTVEFAPVEGEGRFAVAVARTVAQGNHKGNQRPLAKRIRFPLEGKETFPIANLEVKESTSSDFTDWTLNLFAGQGEVILAWAAKNVTTCEISPPIPGWDNTVIEGAIQFPTPMDSKPFVLSCRDAVGRSAVDSVYINNPLAMGFSIRGWPFVGPASNEAITVPKNTPIELNWASAGAAGCELVQDGVHLVDAVPTVGGQFITVNLTESRDYTFASRCWTSTTTGEAEPITVHVSPKETCNTFLERNNTPALKTVAPDYFWSWRVWIPEAPLATLGISGSIQLGDVNDHDEIYALSNQRAYVNWLPKNGGRPMDDTITHDGQTYQLRDPASGQPGTMECPVFLSQICPLIVSVENEPVQLSAPGKGVMFDFQGKGAKEKFFWPKNVKSSKFLVLDINNSGVIDDVHELFGNTTGGPDAKGAANGFESLRKHDHNKDNQIDPKDRIFSKLRLWSDINSNGIGESSELTTLDEENILSISLAYTQKFERNDVYGNSVNQRSHVTRKDGQKRPIVDQWFVRSGVR